MNNAFRLLFSALPALSGLAAAAAEVNQSARAIPVIHEVDVVVVGGSTGAVAAAVSAAGSGAKVFLAAPKTYLGEDMCATLRLWLEPGEEPAHTLAKRVFSDWAGGGVSRDPVRPMHVKKTLDDALLAAQIPYLFSSYVTDIIRDSRGAPAGVVIANRAGRQAVLAKVIVDATPRASVARLAGAKSRRYPAGSRRFVRHVIGGDVKTGAGIVSGRKLDLAYRGDGTLKARETESARTFSVIEYQLDIPMPDGSFASFARAEQVARDLTYDHEQGTAAEELFQVPPDPVRGARNSRGTWNGAGALDLSALRPAGVPRVYVLSGSADVSREQAERLLRPPALIELGARVGQEAAKLASGIATPSNPMASPLRARRTGAGDVREALAGKRGDGRSERTIDSAAGVLPVFGSYDVVVVGGGTGGAPAGIAAARSGAKTLVLEYLHGLGGVGTMGMISRYWWGYRGGFTKEVPGSGGGTGNNPRFDWNPLHRSEWFRRSIRHAGGDVWYGVIGAGAFLEGNRVAGVAVATPEGRGVVLAKTVIDATGNADVAAAAGAQTLYTDASELAVQGAGLPSINLGSRYTNTDFTITDETDVQDVWHVLVYAKEKYSAQFDMGQLIDTRERRRIVGDFEMGILDQMLARRHPDTIAVAFSNFDTHGYTVHPYFLVDHPEKQGFSVDLPYRCLLPKGLEGILTIGLGISVHRDAVPLIRMQPDIQNHGYAAGLAASMAVKQGVSPRHIPVKELQKRLVELEIVPARVLAEKDTFPLTDDDIAAAVRDFPRDTHKAAVILAHPEPSSPLLRTAYQAAVSEEERLAYALMLAVLGDASGLNTLIAVTDSRGWDQGWRYTGMGQFGGALSAIDRYIVAMGRTRDRRALDAIFRKADSLTADSEFSHHRAVALALESIGDAQAADVLARLLSQSGMRGHAVTKVQQAGKLSGDNVNETHTRGLSLRELGLARALYRCGDKNGLGEAILTEYTQDLRGHLARHARAVLEDPRTRVR